MIFAFYTVEFFILIKHSIKDKLEMITSEAENNLELLIFTIQMVR